MSYFNIVAFSEYENILEAEWFQVTEGTEGI